MIIEGKPYHEYCDLISPEMLADKKMDAKKFYEDFARKVMLRHGKVHPGENIIPESITVEFIPREYGVDGVFVYATGICSCDCTPEEIKEIKRRCNSATINGG